MTVSMIGEEARRQCVEIEGRLTDYVDACVGGGSNAAGIFAPFADDRSVKLNGGEAGGRSSALGQHADSLSAGNKVLGTTIAELGNRNRPIDMVVYQKDGKDFLLMSNTDRGVMKIPTATFATEAPITARVPTGTAGVKYETVASMTGIEQLDLLDATRTIVIARGTDGSRSLQIVILP